MSVVGEGPFALGRSAFSTLGNSRWQRQPGVYSCLLRHLFPQQFHISLPLRHDFSFWSDKEFSITCRVELVYSLDNELLAYDELFAELLKCSNERILSVGLGVDDFGTRLKSSESSLQGFYKRVTHSSWFENCSPCCISFPSSLVSFVPKGHCEYCPE